MKVPLSVELDYMGPDKDIIMTQIVNEEDRRYVCQGLFQYNVRNTNSLLKRPGINVDLVLKTPDDQVVGGIFCDTFLDCLYIDVLWVDERYRGCGYGKMLVIEAEKIARDNGCTFVHTATFSYQSPGFYWKLGYETFGMIDDYPRGIEEYFLKKML